ncbi:MAG: acyclic terpene utilization AtuA family protein [Pseudomonadota bacterium]
MSAATLRLGGAIGYWGESPVAVGQFLDAGCVDVILCDYLAEITLSIMARQRTADPKAGFAADFITTVVKPHLKRLVEQRVKLVANAGGVNPAECARQVRAVADALGVTVSIAVVEGDDLLDRREALVAAGHREMFTGAPLPAAEGITSINAYVGAFPIARALDAGADIVITGRCVDSALALGPCIHAFGWQPDEFDRLAAGSLAGHLLECGPQATGGNFTDWQHVDGTLDTIGYPVATISADGAIEITKPPNTGGAVTVGTVSEQLVYEIGDPQAYVLPDVVCDFSEVRIEQAGENRVRVTGATGRAAPSTYKVSLTAHDGFRGGAYLTFYGFDAEARAQALAEAAFRRARAALEMMQLVDFTETSVEVLGADSQFGPARELASPREVVVKIAARHSKAQGIGALLKTLAGLGLVAPPGLSGFAGGRPKPAPVLRLHSFLLAKGEVPVTVNVDGKAVTCTVAPGVAFDASRIERPLPPPLIDEEALVELPLVALAWGRSGDKGDKANIGIIARRAEYLPYLWAALTPAVVAGRFAHFLGEGGEDRVERFLLPGSNAINFLLHDVLGGGGVASLRNDPQGKGYAQLLLHAQIALPARLARCAS